VYHAGSRTITGEFCNEIPVPVDWEADRTVDRGRQTMPDWEQIVREFGPVVWRAASRLLTIEADVADCFQRTFLSAVETVPAKPVRNWGAFLKRVATARALEQLRSRYRDAARSGVMPEELPPDPSASDPLDRVAAGELAAALRVALSAIDPQQAEVFCLTCLDDLSYDDAAVQLEITPNYVGVLLNRARTALRERLHAFDPNPHHLPGGHK
jgi:RNA polymerase sigma-70 factor (ECF subfamily)